MKTYLRHSVENVIDIKELFALEYLDLKGKYKDYSEAHEFWELCYVEQGELLLITEFEKITLKGGEVILIPPSRSHSYREVTPSKAFVICFECSSQALRPIAGERFLLNAEQLAAMKIVIKEAGSSFKMNDEDQLVVSESPLFGGQQVIIAQLEYFLICAARMFSSDENANIVFLSGEDFYADLVAVVLRYFRQNIRNRLNLERICGKLNYSRSFLCRTFKEQTGETLMACFNRMKIEEAERMLRDTKISTTGISEELGFSDAKYFSFIFKKQTGISPAAYRKQIRKEMENDD